MNILQIPIKHQKTLLLYYQNMADQLSTQIENLSGELAEINDLIANIKGANREYVVPQAMLFGGGDAVHASEYNEYDKRWQNHEKATFALGLLQKPSTTREIISKLKEFDDFYKDSENEKKAISNFSAILGIGTKQNRFTRYNFNGSEIKWGLYLWEKQTQPTSKNDGTDI